VSAVRMGIYHGQSFVRATIPAAAIAAEEKQ
jgi:hypothetical protein